MVCIDGYSDREELKKRISIPEDEKYGATTRIAARAKEKEGAWNERQRMEEIVRVGGHLRSTGITRKRKLMVLIIYWDRLVLPLRGKEFINYPRAIYFSRVESYNISIFAFLLHLQRSILINLYPPRCMIVIPPLIITIRLLRLN